MDLEVEAATYMDVDLYKAAVDGNFEAFNDYKGRFDCLVTRNQNTVLHVHLANRWQKVRVFHLIFIYYLRKRTPTSSSTEFVERLLNKCPSLLLQANAKGEIPLHIVARHGHCSIVKLLLERAKLAQQGDPEKVLEAVKEMLRTRDEEENTPLHNAARYGHLEVAGALIEADPAFVYPANRKGETPLYIAARRGYHLLVAEMLNKCKSVAHAGRKGTTALHAAVMANDTRTVEIILKEKKILTNETDDDGRSTLHFAAHLGYRSIVIQLLECDNSTAYLADVVGKMTALHMAARQGHALIMEDIIRRCPDCCELVDQRGWNFLHFAVVALRAFSLYRFLGEDIDNEYASVGNALVQKDVYGNTPIQVLLASRPFRYVLAMLFNKDTVELSSIEDLTKKEEKQILGMLKKAGNARVAGVRVHSMKRFGKVSTEFQKAAHSQLVAAALIATVTFTAAFTLPGGVKNEKGPDQGTAILIRNAAFNVFVVSDAVAVFSSLFAVLNYFLMARPLSGQFSRYSFASYNFAYESTLLAVGAMVVAFISGTFAVLETSLGLALVPFFTGLGFLLLTIYYVVFSVMDVSSFLG